MSIHRFSRRTMLRGLGVTMALPWLESINVWGDEPTGREPSSEAPLRLAVLFSGNGFHAREWWAKGEGANMELGQVLAPLNDYRERLLFIQGHVHRHYQMRQGLQPRKPRVICKQLEKMIW